MFTDIIGPYKGYLGTLKAEDNKFCGTILGTQIVFEGRSIKLALIAFKTEVENLIEHKQSKKGAKNETKIN